MAAICAPASNSFESIGYGASLPAAPNEGELDPAEERVIDLRRRLEQLRRLAVDDLEVPLFGRLRVVRVH